MQSLQLSNADLIPVLNSLCEGVYFWVFEEISYSQNSYRFSHEWVLGCYNERNGETGLFFITHRRRVTSGYCVQEKKFEVAILRGKKVEMKQEGCSFSFQLPEVEKTVVIHSFEDNSTSPDINTHNFDALSPFFPQYSPKKRKAFPDKLLQSLTKHSSNAKPLSRIDTEQFKKIYQGPLITCAWGPNLQKSARK